jgi:hypothetical protein
MKRALPSAAAAPLSPCASMVLAQRAKSKKTEMRVTLRRYDVMPLLKENKSEGGMRNKSGMIPLRFGVGFGETIIFRQDEHERNRMKYEKT